MEKFIEVHEAIINIKDIRKVEFISDDIYMGLFKNLEGEVVIDNTPFEFAKITTFVGDFSMVLDLYLPEEYETEDEWIRRNRTYINMMMADLKSVLLPVKVTDKEYEFC